MWDLHDMDSLDNRHSTIAPSLNELLRPNAVLNTENRFFLQYEHTVPINGHYKEYSEGNGLHLLSAPLLDYFEGERNEGSTELSSKEFHTPQKPKYWFLEVFGILGEPNTLTLAWLIFRMVMFGVLLVLPFALYQLSTIKYICWAPLMGILACAIPSGGAPVAGGIIFLPIITFVSIFSPYKISATEAVCFSAATQMVGVGLLVPATWYVTDRSVFDWKVIGFSLIPCTATCVLILQFGQFHGTTGDLVTVIVFGLFCLFCAVVTLHGLIKGTLVQQNSQVKWTWKTIMILLLTNLFGGVLVAYIGIGVEKILFIALTSYNKMGVRAAGLSSITVVGFVSYVSYGYRFYSNPSCVEHTMALWVMGLCGIMMGCTIGPWLNKKLGPRNVMIAFVIFLLLEVLRAAANVIVYGITGVLY